MPNENALPEAAMPDIDRGIEDIVRRGARPVLTVRGNKEKPGAAPTSLGVKPNPFAATEEAHRAVTELHRAFSELAERLIANVPAWEPADASSTNLTLGLFGLANLAALETRDRAMHMLEVVKRLEEHLQ